MKYYEWVWEVLYGKSHPMRGGWIEIFLHLWIWAYPSSPTPCGVGGLKLDGFSIRRHLFFGSHPMRGGWIEIAGGVGLL